MKTFIELALETEFGKRLINADGYTAETIIENHCPYEFNLESRDEDCKTDDYGEVDCDKCWKRTIYDAKETADLYEKALQVIKDSGDRTKFETGAVRDMHSGKGRMDLLPWHAIIEVSKHCENGAVKYGEHNVDKGIPVHSLLDSGIRHTAKFITRQEDEPHLVAACWNLLWALEMMLTKPEMDDRYKEEK